MKIQLGLILAMSFLLQACFDSGGGGASGPSSGDGFTLQGVAATGAAISNARIEIYDGEGISVPAHTENTNSKGEYRASTRNFVPPFLVIIRPLTGLPFLSMASEADVLNGRSVNVTPLTHVVVSNVFGTTDLAAIKNAQKDAAKDKVLFEDKLLEKKQQLQKSLENVMTALRIAPEIDIMNGVLIANSGQGMDGLLDAIDLKQDGNHGSTISLKGGPKVVEVTPESEPKVTPVVKDDVDAVSDQLKALDEIKTLYRNFHSELNAIGDSCEGPAVEDSSACSKDKLFARVRAFMDDGYLWDGLGVTEETWSWFCGYDNECLNIEIDIGILNDFTILSYVKNNDGSEVAHVRFNVYEDEEIVETESELVRRGVDGKWRLFGNNQPLQLGFDSGSFQEKIYEQGTLLSKDNKTYLSYWMHDSKKLVSEPLLVAVNNRGEVMENLNKAIGAANGQASSEQGLVFSINEFNGYNYLFLEGLDLKEDIKISSEAHALLDTHQRFFFKYKYDGVDKVNEFFIIKPVMLNEENELELLAQFEDEDSICVKPRSSYVINSPTGIHLFQSHFDFNLIKGGTSEPYLVAGSHESDVTQSQVTVTPVITKVDGELLNELPTELFMDSGNAALWHVNQAGSGFMKFISCQ